MRQQDGWVGGWRLLAYLNDRRIRGASLVSLKRIEFKATRRAQAALSMMMLMSIVSSSLLFPSLFDDEPNRN